MSAAPTNHNVRSTTGTGSSRKLCNKLVSGTAAVRIVLRLVSACTSVCSDVCSSTTVIFSASPLELLLHAQDSQVKKGINLKPWFKERKLLLARVRGCLYSPSCREHPFSAAYIQRAERVCIRTGPGSFGGSGAQKEGPGYCHCFPSPLLFPSRGNVADQYADVSTRGH